MSQSQEIGKSGTDKAASARGDALAVGPIINRNIFGQFAEMLGHGIYGGVWVGHDSPIPNVRGIRCDVVDALRALKVPNVRWPGGCYADLYQWRNGIGPAENRPVTVNVIWGLVPDDNSFGTHEFMDFIEQIGSEAYLSLNVATATVQGVADWIEYMTTTQPTSLGLERRANGREEPWRIKFLGLGNEAWGCGGPFTPDEYVTQMKLFGTHVRNHHPEQVASFFEKNPNVSQYIASAEALGKPEFTEAIMEAWSTRLPYFWNISGLSVHHYTHLSPTPMQDDSLGFGEDQYAAMLAKAYTMHDLIVEHGAVMDKYDPDRQVALVIDEWGAWLKPLPGTNPMFLRQQNSLRDALLAAITLNIFTRHADRVRMTNIAQMVNVIQSMILTDGPHMVLTPTYHVYRMYVPFQDATAIPLEVTTGEYCHGEHTLPRVDTIAARATDGTVWLAAVNPDPADETDLSIALSGMTIAGAIGEVLTADRVDAINDFGASEAVRPVPTKASATDKGLFLRLPPRSLSVVRLLQ